MRSDSSPGDTGTLSGLRILLGVTGGIGAYKAALLARLLVGHGAVVDAVLTRGATHFVGAATFEGITGRPVRTEVWDGVADDTHVELGRRADAVLVYPVTAHTIARLASGLADDLLTSTVLVARCPILLAPAMHTEMWTHPATVDNVARLVARGVRLVGPDDGPLMGGDRGVGRLVEPDVAVARLIECLETHEPASDRPLRGVHVLVTAGGTREPIDTVRFIGNRSSGRMGFAVARAAVRRGARVTVVAGPSDVPTPLGMERIDVTTAAEMREVVMDLATEVDVVVKAAAVADFRPVAAADHKLKKDDGPPVIELVPTSDILAELGERRGDARRPLLVGFAAETDNVQANAFAKLERKRADLLVVNDVSRPDIGFEVDTNEVAFVDADGWRDVPRDTKAAIGERIADEIVARLARS
ncbi:MAG: bifunctional phosphopantothenoylcysteine decarboxylase/phosphopantothenate--cysteine ligase CoaBC [Nitriliruptoraceae bacterium]